MIAPEIFHVVSDSVQLLLYVRCTRVIFRCGWLRGADTHSCCRAGSVDAADTAYSLLDACVCPDSTYRMQVYVIHILILRCQNSDLTLNA